MHAREALAQVCWAGLSAHPTEHQQCRQQASLLPAGACIHLCLIYQRRACAAAAGKSPELKVCARCQSAKYCSRACQVGCFSRRGA